MPLRYEIDQEARLARVNGAGKADFDYLLGFSNIRVIGIPLEELLYGFGAGVAATAFYPYTFHRRFTPPGGR
jgi:hypothetical protein